MSRGFNATGTIMKNRLPKHCIMSSDRDFMKKMRGSTEVNCREDGKIAITKWLDNKLVILASTCLSDVFCNMGGVDLADRMLVVCPARSRTRKWTIRFIFHMIDLSVSNAWILYRKRQFSQNIPHYKVKNLRKYKLNLGIKLIEDNCESDKESSEED
ncbi:hypothetical protein QE152_g35177 [Popillia japonica]|uniref:PiggyBac transposable element-derived protein domain-containing protein n=1 Tax=Popillia japonica TaxID=7064 RepID=A0AAW1IGH1_POPJA